MKIYFLSKIFWKALERPFKWHIGKLCSISRKKVTLKNKKSLTFCPIIDDLRHCGLMDRQTDKQTNNQMNEWTNEWTAIDGCRVTFATDKALGSIAKSYTCYNWDSSQTSMFLSLGQHPSPSTLYSIILGLIQAQPKLLFWDESQKVQINNFGIGGLITIFLVLLICRNKSFK